MRDVLAVALNLGVALCAWWAATLWFQSAPEPLPPMVAYWDAAPENDPFFMALRKGSTLNKRPARWAAAGAILTGVTAILPLAWR